MSGAAMHPPPLGSTRLTLTLSAYPRLPSSSHRNDTSNDTLAQWFGANDMSVELSAICDRCSSAAITIAAVIPPLGNAVRKQIFYCEPCDHYTFIDWLGSLPQTSA